MKYTSPRLALKVSGAALLACTLAFGCGDDDDGDDGGRGGTAGTGGSAGSAGSGGTAGTAGSAGSAGSAGDAGNQPANFATTDAGALGTVITGNGNVLYTHARDVPAYAGDPPDAGLIGDAGPQGPTPPAANCAGAACLTPFYGTPREVGSGLDPNDFSEFTRADQNKQSTYKGWPLYFSSSPDAGAPELWPAASVPHYTLMIMEQTVGDAGTLRFLADGRGFALYVWPGANDTPAGDGGTPISSCGHEVGRNGTSCLQRWPPVLPAALEKLPPGLDAADFTTFSRQFDGGGPDFIQVAYKGWPLYYYFRDRVPGETRGHNSGSWMLAEVGKSDYSEPDGG